MSYQGTETSSSGSQSIGMLAYAKIFLHAAKYPSECVGGFVLGTKHGAVTDVLPVFHETPIGPIMDTAAKVAEGMKQPEDCIIGFYFGSKMTAVDTQTSPYFLGPVMNEIARNNNGSSLMFRVENGRLSGANRDQLCVTATKGLSGKTLECMSDQSAQSNKDMNAKVSLSEYARAYVGTQ